MLLSTNFKKINQFFKMCKCVCAWASILRHLLFLYREGGTPALNSACKTDRADLIDWMSFLPSHLMEEMNSNTKVDNANT